MRPSQRNAVGPSTSAVFPARRRPVRTGVRSVAYVMPSFTNSVTRPWHRSPTHTPAFAWSYSVSTVTLMVNMRFIVAAYPRLMTTLVFPHGRGRDGTLMWALRSIAHHYDPAELDIIVAGHLPDWLHPDTVTGVHVRQHHNRAMLNVWNALTAVAELIGDGPFVLMNDDFFATSAADLETLTNRGPAAEHVEAMRANRAGAFYRSRLARSVRLLEDEGRTDPASWETHTPLPTTGAAVRAVGNLLRSRNLGGGVVAQRTLLGELGGLPGRRVAD